MLGRAHFTHREALSERQRSIALRYTAGIAGALFLVFAAFRLLSTFSVGIGTIAISCGNAAAYLGDQDSASSLEQMRAACAGALDARSIEGLLSLIAGLVALGYASRPSIVRLLKSARDRSRRLHAHDSYQVLRSDELGDAQKGADASVAPRVLSFGFPAMPLTVLGFFGGIFTVLVLGSVALIAVMEIGHIATTYIGGILVFDALVTVALIAGVSVAVTKNPTRLLLSEIANQNAVLPQRSSPTPTRSVHEAVASPAPDAVAETATATAPEARIAERPASRPTKSPARPTSPRATSPRSTAPRSTAPRSTGQRSTGQRSTGQRSTGQRSTGQRSTGGATKKPITSPARRPTKSPAGSTSPVGRANTTRPTSTVAKKPPTSTARRPTKSPALPRAVVTVLPVLTAEVDREAADHANAYLDLDAIQQWRMRDDREGAL